MKKILALVAMLLFASPVFAADNAIVLTPGTGVSAKCKDIGSTVCVPQGIDYFGAAQLSSAAISASSSGNNTLVTRSVGTIKVYGIFFACASAVVATLQNGTSTGVTGAMTLATFFLPISREPYFTTTSTNNFVLNLGTGVQCSGTVYYLDN